jgi:hypothetical protein
MMQHLSSCLFLTLQFPPFVKDEVRCLNGLQRVTKVFLVRQIGQWSQHVPVLQDLQWLENYAIAGRDMEQIQHEQHIFTSSVSEGEANMRVATLVSTEEIAAICSENAIVASLICNCPLFWWVRAHKAGALEGLEMLQLVENVFTVDQVAQINRVTVIMHLQSKSVHGNCTAKAIDGFNRSAKEYYWKKLFGSGKGRSCQKLMGVLKNQLSLEPVLKKQWPRWLRSQKGRGLQKKRTKYLLFDFSLSLSHELCVCWPMNQCMHWSKIMA